MGIELRITPLNAGQPGDITALAFDEAEITIGAYNDDTVKLDRTLLQGCHARLSEQWDEDAGHYRVILTNISGASIIMVNNSPLISDEYCLIDGSSEMRMGNYLVRARSSLRDGVQSASLNQAVADAAPPAAPEQPAPIMQNAAPAPATSTGVDAAQDVHRVAPPASVESVNPTPAQASVSTTSSVAAPPVPPMNTEPQIPVLQKPADAAPAASTPMASPPPAQASAPAMTAPAVPATSAQPAAPHTAEPPPAHTPTRADTPASGNATMVFDDIAGNFSELSLDFDILRLCKLQGRIMHGEQPVANVIVDAGEHGHATTDFHGYFCIDGVTEGSSYRLSLRHNDFQFHESQDMAGVISDDLNLRVNAIKLIDVAGRIMHRGKPVPGIELDAGPFGRSVSDENGYYVFPRVPETARIQIRALNTGYQYKSAARGQSETASTASSTTTTASHWDRQKTVASA